MTPFERLKTVLEGPHVDAVKSWKGAVKIVCKGDAISELASAQIQSGQDVFGEDIILERPETLKVEAGENASLDED